MRHRAQGIWLKGSTVFSLRPVSCVLSQAVKQPMFRLLQKTPLTLSAAALFEMGNSIHRIGGRDLSLVTRYWSLFCFEP